MNLSTRLAKLKQQKQRSADQEERMAPPAQRHWLALGSVLLLCGLVAAAAAVTFFVFDRYVLASVPSEMVGSWGVDGGEQDGATLELNRNGTFRATVNIRGSEAVASGRLEVKDKSITFYTVNPETKKEEPKTQAIEHVGKDEMRLRDSAGTVMKLVRLD